MQEELRAEYGAFLKEFSYGSIRGVAYVGIVLILLGIGLDYNLYPDRMGLFAAVRVGISALIFGIILLMNTAWGRNHTQLLAFVWLLFPQIMISWIIGVTEGPASLYWAGLNLAIFAAGIVLVFSLWQNVAFGGISFLLYAAACAFHQKGLEWHGAFLINSILLWMAVAVSTAYNYFNERARFMLFRLKVELANKNLQLEEANKHLANINLVERKLAALKEQELNSFNEAIVESSPAGIVFYKADGQCVMANEAFAKSIGGTVADILKTNFRENAAWARHGLIDCANRALETGLPVRRDIEGATAFNKEVMLECIFAPIRISGRSHLLLVTNDIKNRVEVERALQESMQKLEEKEQSKTRFLAAAGHDLRQPLAAANLFIDALKYTEPTPEQDEILQRLDQAMSNFNDLLNALLNVSKLDAGMIKPEYASINVADIFDWLEQSFCMMALQKQLEFRLVFPEGETPHVHGDIGLIKTVLMNLVSNAIKFTSKGGVLAGARRRGGKVLFQVWDTGIGIPEDSLGKIFDEFYQDNNPQRDRTQGLGLGLSIAKRALLLLDGKITCRSRKGHGSVFEFCLPLAAPEEAPHIADTQAPHNSAELLSLASGKLFIVVEDDKLVAEALGKSITAMQGKVECFHSAEDALNHADIEGADYYIADHMLSGSQSGVDLLNQIRLKRNRPIKAVIMSGDTSADFIRKADSFDWPVIHKPANMHQLLSKLNEM